MARDLMIEIWMQESISPSKQDWEMIQIAIKKI